MMTDIHTRTHIKRERETESLSDTGETHTLLHQFRTYIPYFVFVLNPISKLSNFYQLSFTGAPHNCSYIEGRTQETNGTKQGELGEKHLHIILLLFLFLRANY